MNKYLVQKIIALFFFTLAYLFLPVVLKSQICDNYLLIPDSVFINTPAFFEVQQDNGSTTPPTLWICNWIDFEANGSHECSNISSCQYAFPSGGLMPVQFEINEPFLNNTEVCTKYVYVNPCDAPSLVAKANSISDTAVVCGGTQLLLTSSPSAGQSCSGIWQYSWFNGNTYFDGNDFLSLNEVWNNAFQNATFNDINSARKFTVKVRCSASPNCIDSSKVYVSVKNTIQNPVFDPLPAQSRCQGVDTLFISALEPNADSIKYKIDLSSMTAGNYINSHSGVLIFDSLFHGPTTILATAYGCDGPKTATCQIFTHPLPNLSIPVSDSTYMCLGDSIFLPLVFSGNAPFNLKYNLGIPPEYQFSTLLLNDHLTFVANDTDVVYNFYELNDLYCTLSFDTKKRFLSSAKPVFTTLTDTLLCADASINLDLGAANYQYFWAHDSSTLNTTLIDTSIANFGIGSNWVFVSITNNYCTVVDSADVVFTICSSDNSAKDLPLQFFTYPNPASKIFYIGSLSVNEKIIEVEVFTPDGQLVLFEKGIVGLNNPLALMIERKGIYFIKCKVQGYNPALKKIIIN